MERMRWMPKEPSGNRIVANIPEYKLHVYEASKKVFDMDIVVGTEANKTVVFNDVLKYVVFSPYWNIPRSIIRNEIQPAMRKSSNYLARKNMEQTGFSDGLPIIRQKPGGANALGSVKFIFPNNYNIYFHDTPAKSLFGKEKRAFSHGCVRLAEPKKLAAYLLRNQPEWTSQKISEAMNASKEKWVTLKEPIPVVITYFTSWISSDGLLNFRDDIYGHDKKMAERLFEQRDPDSLTERTTFSVKNAG
jgi:murein L,D-transpeptidase YcbB/YkuD